MAAKHLRGIDLFAGCGGMSLGFQTAGVEVVAAFEYWSPAIEVYRENFDHPIVNVDLGNPNLDLEQLKTFSPDIIFGGPPCQDFSHAGKRNEELGRADLTLAFAQITISLRPRFFVMENVDRILKSYKYQLAKDRLRQAGYSFTEIILNANYYHVPQTRKRLFLIGELDACDQFTAHLLDKHLSPKPLTVRQYFTEQLSQVLDTQFYYRHPRNYSRRGIYSVDEPSATIRGVNRPIPKNYQIHPADACYSLDRVRPLTTRERASIQTFPPTFVFKGTKTNVEQMIGNAVPVKLAQYVAQALMDYLSQDSSAFLSGEQLSLFSGQLQANSHLVLSR